MDALSGADPSLLSFEITRGQGLVFGISWWILVPVVLVVLAFAGVVLWKRRGSPKRSRVKLKINLGGIGEVEITPAVEDLEIAHKIWVELVTRKAAITVDPDHDVIVEVYNSWYALFGRVRDLIGEIPGDMLKRESTRQLINIAVGTLNRGMRPHLTRWQARYRAWYETQREQLKDRSPQDLQRDFPEYEALMSDMLAVNRGLVAYATELERLWKES